VSIVRAGSNHESPQPFRGAAGRDTPTFTVLRQV
jgi:hypothetical protein